MINKFTIVVLIYFLRSMFMSTEIECESNKLKLNPAKWHKLYFIHVSSMVLSGIYYFFNLIYYLKLLYTIYVNWNWVIQA